MAGVSCISGNQFRAVKPGQLSEGDQELLNVKLDQYLKNRKEFLNPQK